MKKRLVKKLKRVLHPCRRCGCKAPREGVRYQNIVACPRCGRVSQRWLFREDAKLQWNGGVPRYHWCRGVPNKVMR
jgi:hypothetical protein